MANEPSGMKAAMRGKGMPPKMTGSAAGGLGRQRREILHLLAAPHAHAEVRGEALDLATRLAAHDWLDLHLPAQVVLAPQGVMPQLIEAHGAID